MLSRTAFASNLRSPRIIAGLSRPVIQSLSLLQLQQRAFNRNLAAREEQKEKPAPAAAEPKAELPFHAKLKQNENILKEPVVGETKKTNGLFQRDELLVLLIGMVLFGGLTYYVTSDQFLDLCVSALIKKYIKDNRDKNREELIKAFGAESVNADPHLPLGIENLTYDKVTGCLLCGGMTFHNVRLKGTFVTTRATGADASDPKAAVALSDRSTEVDLMLEQVIVMVPWKDILVKRWKANRFLKSLESKTAESVAEKSEADVREMFTLDIPLLRIYGASGRVTQHPIQNVAAAAALNMNLKTHFSYRLGNVRLTRANVSVSTVRPGKTTAFGMVQPKRYPPVHVNIQDLYMLDFLNTRSLFHDIAFRSLTSGALDGKPFSIEIYRSYLENIAAAEAQEAQAAAGKKQMIVEPVKKFTKGLDVQPVPAEHLDEKIVSIWRGEGISLPALMRLFGPTLPLTSWFDSAETDILVRSVESPDQKPDEDVTMHWTMQMKNSSIQARTDGMLAPVQPDDSDNKKKIKEAIEAFKPFVNMLNMEKTINLDFSLNVKKEHLSRSDADRALRQIVVDIVVKELQRRANSDKKYTRR